jgi:zinc transporter 1
MRRERSPSPFPRRTRQQQPHTQSIDAALEDDQSERVASNSSDATLIREVSNTHNDHERTPLLVPTDRSENVTGHRNAGGHSHGSMNMKAILLHVLGDALGNVGVIASGLIIWLTTWPFKFYFDPIISLVITVIIFSSALPLGE